ncbi:MAG: hypothetical protein K8R90_10305 [Candidatus Cloacimonetes bacterium]|nr:hypothetical protein [Candidatus Cloacimonadota bacterium]
MLVAAGSGVVNAAALMEVGLVTDANFLWNTFGASELTYDLSWKHRIYLDKSFAFYCINVIGGLK